MGLARECMGASYALGTEQGKYGHNETPLQAQWRSPSTSVVHVSQSASKNGSGLSPKVII